MFCTNCGKSASVGHTHCAQCGAVLQPTIEGLGGVTTPLPAAGNSLAGNADLSPAGSGAGQTLASAPTIQLQGGQLVGRTLGGRYQLTEAIGSGGMGEIYRARRTHIGDTVAVKVLRADVVNNEKSRQRFYREARAAALLHHPNAVVIHDFGEDSDGTAYIVMELLIGRSLRHLLASEGALDAVRTYGIMRQACAALEAGHRTGIVHRDIKPDNIFLLDATDESDHVKILDFGIAKLHEANLDSLSGESNNLTNAGTIIGTPNYMSPEQCRGEEADARSDIYSLGVVLYEMLTGTLPFMAKNATGIAIKHVTEKPRALRELVSDLPSEIDAVILRALEKEPNNRQASMLTLAREFANALRQSGVTSALAQRSGGGRTSMIPLDTPHTDEIATVRPTVAVQGEDLNRTNLTPAEGLASFANGDTDDFKTIIAEPAVETITVPRAEAVTVIVNVPSGLAAQADAKVAADQRVEPAETDEYATMVPEDPNAPPRANPFAVQVGEQNPTELIRSTTFSAPPVTPAATPTAVSQPASSASAVGERPIAATTAAKSNKKGGKAAKQTEARKPSADQPSEAATVIEIPQVRDTASLSPRKSSGGVRVALMIGIGGALLAAGVWAWSVLVPKPLPATNATNPNAASKPLVKVNPAQPATPLAPAGMVYIAGGDVQLGREDGEENERPVQRVIVSPYFIDRNEVTNAQYAQFLEATGYLVPPSWKGKRLPESQAALPVTDVTWEDANEYAKWAKKRLPTEAEWEYAARGPQGNLYPWGNEWRAELANVSNGPSDRRKLEPGGKHAAGASYFGVLDMAGNVWEWTADEYQAYPGGKLTLPEGYGQLRVIRGGSYESQRNQVTTTYRRGWPATRKDWPNETEPQYVLTGFRCVQDVLQR